METYRPHPRLQQQGQGQAEEGTRIIPPSLDTWTQLPAVTQGRDVGLQLLTSPVTEPMCQPEPALILGRGGQQTGMRTGKVCESCLMNLLEHTEDMTESRDGRQNSLQLQPGTSPFSKYSCTVKSRHPCLSWIFLGAIFF